MIIAIGSDHTGYDMKEMIIQHLFDKKISVIDFGTDSTYKVSFVNYANNVVDSVLSGESPFGILISSTGNGVSILSNRYENIRSCVCWDKNISNLSRKNYNSNVLCLPSNFITFDEAYDIVDSFINTTFDDGGDFPYNFDKVTDEIKLLIVKDDVDGFPNTEIKAIVGSENFYINKLVGEGVEIPPIDYDNYNIPHDAISSCGVWWAGVGTFYYIIDEGNYLSIYESISYEEDEIKQYNWIKVRDF